MRRADAVDAVLREIDGFCHSRRCKWRAAAICRAAWLIQVNVAAESLWLMTLSQGDPKPLAAMEMRSILMSVLILTTAGGLTKLLLIEADNTERRFSFWLVRVVGL